jgi:cobalt-zinc-cadmium efflux system outer membrane protein
MAKLEVADRERLIRSEVGEAYAEALAVRRSLDTLGQLSRLNKEYLSVAQARVDQGEAAPVERGLLQVEFSRIETDRLRLEADSNRALVVLKNLAGLKLDAEILLDGELTSQSTDFNVTALIDGALANRPDAQSARLEEQGREAEVRLARAEATPNVVGFVRYTFKGSRFDQLGLNASGQTVPLTDHDNVVTGGVSIDLKTRNRNQGEIEAAIAREQAAKYRTTSLTQLVEREVRSAAGRYDAARKTVAIFDGSLLSQSQQNLNAIRAAYEIGELRVFELLSEQRRLVETQRSYIDALKEVYLSRFELERVAGGPLQ